MIWKNLPNWLRVGLIIGIIGLISTLIFLFGVSVLGNTQEFIIWIFAPFMIISLPGLIASLFLGIIEICFPLVALCPPPKINPYAGFIISAIFNFIIYFFIGALIGFIIGKIKSKIIKIIVIIILIVGGAILGWYYFA